MRLATTAGLLLALAASPSAQQDVPRKLVAPPQAAARGGDTCDLGTAEARLDEGGVEAALFNNGALFWAGREIVYEVPRGFGTNAIRRAGLWIGGEMNGDLRFATSHYSPYEFWPGPLGANGETTAQTCTQFDRFWNVRQSDVEAYDAGSPATPDLQGWPIAWGAPFYVDANANSRRDSDEPVTELDLGDAGYGTRTIDLLAGERPLVHGSQTIWWVMNDNGGEHHTSSEEALEIEVRVAAFGVADPARPELDRSTFYRYTVLNRSADTLENGRLGIWVDAALGYSGDDYLGSDPSRGMLYFYNRDEHDEGGYGIPPPALGIDWLSGSSAAMTYYYENSATGYPTNGADYYNLLGARWRDGMPLTEGGRGYQTGDPTSWIFNGDPVTRSFWSEEDTDGLGTRGWGGDRWGTLSANTFSLAPGESQTFDLAIVYGHGEDRLASVTALREADNEVQALYDGGSLLDAVSPVILPPPPVPTAAPSLTSPADGTVYTEGSVPLAWTPVPDAEWYEVELAVLNDFSYVLASVRVEGEGADLPADAIPANYQVPFHWRVRAVNRSGRGPVSESRTFAYNRFELGVARLDDGSPAFVEVASPSGIDPCGPQAGSTIGCTEVGGNGVEGSLNSDGTYRMTFSGPSGSAATLGSYAPTDYEIRFTEEGSFAVWPFVGTVEELTLVRVPFEVWDIGVTTPFTQNDPSDDVQMIPVLFSDNGGNCAFDYGELEIDGLPATDRIYAQFVRDADGDGDRDNDDYAAYAASAAALLPTPESCAMGQGVFDGPYSLIDFGYGRPIQRQVFVDHTGTGDLATLQGTAVRFYTTDPPSTAGETGSGEEAVALGAAYPNPVRGMLTVPYRLAQPTEVRVTVFDALGREVAVLARGAHTPGPHEARLDASALAAGVYTVLLEAGEVRSVRRAVVAR